MSHLHPRPSPKPSTTRIAETALASQRASQAVTCQTVLLHQESQLQAVQRAQVQVLLPHLLLPRLVVHARLQVLSCSEPLVYSVWQRYRSDRAMLHEIVSLPYLGILDTFSAEDKIASKHCT